MENPSKLNQPEVLDGVETERLNRLGVNYEYSTDDSGRGVYIFKNVKEDSPGNFWLEASEKKVLLTSFHYENSVFKGQDKMEISPKDIFETVKNFFPAAEEIVLSCCYPNEAKTALSGTGEELIVLGSNNDEYRTVFNDVARVVVVSPV